jgi:hypothetical protein
MTSLQKMYDTYLRPLNPEWSLPSGSGRRLVVVNAFPLIVLAALITQVVLSYVFGRVELLYYPDDQGGGGPAEVWQRLYRFASAAQTLLGVSVGALFLVGVRGLRRAEGSWMLVFGIVLAITALTFGIAGTLVMTATEDANPISDVGARSWQDIAAICGFLSIGYFFVAYRGLSAPPAETTENRQPITDNQIPDS